MTRDAAESSPVVTGLLTAFTVARLVMVPNGYALEAPTARIISRRASTGGTVSCRCGGAGAGSGP
ncbi:MAG: hypothetical protein R6V28_07825 [Nitriliruptoraceae bacterium]